MDTTRTAAVTVAVDQPGPRLAELLTVARMVDQQKSTQEPVWYRVRPGDSLSSIAGRYYRDQAAWPVLYWANRSQIRSADLIEPGQRLRVPPKPAHVPDPPAPPAPPVQAAAPVRAASARQATVAYAPAAPATYTGASGSYAACVIARESGGNAQIMNATGHYGLYQFSASTWAAYGGNPADFGHASVAEQNQVFNNAIAAGGQSNWSPYDGC